jgi:LuxR family maltose regulon positive regulatory protein
VTTSVAASKLRPPTLARQEVERPRLWDALDWCAVARVAVVFGGPGAGKSLAVSQWVRNRVGHSHWCTLDRADNDPTRFWRHVLAGADLADLAPRSPGRVSPRHAVTFVDELIDGLETRTELPLVVLDGFDVINDATVLAIFDEVVTRAPDGARFVLIGRSRPQLPGLARLRARDEVRAIGPDDLRFDEDDTERLLAMLGIALEPAQVQLLLARTEGWAVGIQLAALALRDAQDVTVTLEEFGGATPDVARYLSAEVLDRLPDATRRFLLETSVAENLTPALCEHLTGRDDAASMLRELERWGVFVHQHDDDPSSYRCHPFMRELLLSELTRSELSTARGLHRAAAQWCERMGDDDGALRHSLAASDTSAAWSRFGEAIVSHFYQGEYATIASWTRLLSGAGGEIEPHQGVGLAIALVFLGQLGDAQRVLARAREGLAGAPTVSPTLAAWLTFADYVVAYARGDLLNAARLGSEARRLLEAAAPGEWNRSRAPLARVALLSLLGRFDRARALHEEYRQTLVMPLAGDEVMLDGLLGEIELEEGNLNEAARLSARGREREDATGNDLGFEIHYVWGCVLLERNDLEAARVALERAVARGDRVGFAHSFVLPRLAMARLLQLQGDTSGARETIGEARVRIDDDAHVLWQRIHEAGALLALAEHDLAAVQLAANQLAEPCRSRVFTRLHLAQGDRQRALAVLQRIPHTTIRDRIDAALLRAQCTPSDIERDAHVGEALALAEPHRYIRVFLDETSWIQPVLTRLVGSWPSRYPVDLLAVLAAEPLTLRMVSGANGLTAREREVLRYLGTPMSMGEIAGALFVSRNTVKSHVRNIYGKLGVRTRREAVALHRHGSESQYSR